MIEVDVCDIDQLIEASSGKTLILFGADDCSLCDVQKNILTLLSTKTNGILEIFHTQLPSDLELRQSFMSKYDIKGFPTVHVYDDGVMIASKRGAMNMSLKANYLKFTKWLDRKFTWS